MASPARIEPVPSGAAASSAVDPPAEVQARPEVAQPPTHPLPACVQPLRGLPALVLALSEIASGLVLGHGGLWPAGREPSLLLLAAALVWGCEWPSGIARGWRGRARFALHAATSLLGTALGVGLASTIAEEAGIGLGVVALLARVHDIRRLPPLVGSVSGAAARAGTFWLGLHGLALAVEAPPTLGHPGFLVLAGLYGTLAFCASWLALLAERRESAPSRLPIDLLKLGSLALVALPFVLLVTYGQIVARVIALAVIGGGVYRLLRLERRKRRWDREALLTAAHEGARCPVLFLAAAVLLPWSYTSLAVCACILAGAWLVQRHLLPEDTADEILASEPTPPLSLAAGLTHLQQIVAPAAPVEPVEPVAPDQATAAPGGGGSPELGVGQDRHELAGTPGELAEARSQLARALQAKASTVAQNEILERRIQKLLRAVQQTEAELQRIVRMQHADPGLASLYREVQGLREGDGQHAQKSAILGAVFEANVELRRELERRGARTGAASPRR